MLINCIFSKKILNNNKQYYYFIINNIKMVLLNLYTELYLRN